MVGKSSLIQTAGALLIAAAFATPAFAVMTLNPVSGGASVAVTGSGAKANGPVELFVNNASRGSVLADGSGNFSFSGQNIASGDVLYTTASQVWNFNTDGNLEGWVAIGGASAVSGGSLAVTWNGTGTPADNITLNLATPGAIVDTNLTRVFEIRYKITGTFSLGSSTAIYDPGTGWQFGPSWAFSPPTGNFITTRMDLSNGGTNNYTSTGTSIQLAPGANGFGAGAVLTVDYIRVAECFDWTFSNAGDLEEWVATAGTATVAGGILTMTNTVASTNAKVSNQFFQIDTAHFNKLSTAIDANPTIAPNLIDFQYFGAGPGFTAGGHQAVWVPVPGTYVATTIDLTGPALFGPGWTGFAALNFPAGGFQPMFPGTVGEVANVDYIRLAPAAAFGPSAPVTAASAVEDWSILE